VRGRARNCTWTAPCLSCYSIAFFLAIHIRHASVALSAAAAVGAAAPGLATSGAVAVAWEAAIAA
jgi:hypothetical protein